MAAAYPTTLDDDTTLGVDMTNTGVITNHVTQPDADKRFNNVKGAITALEAKVGVTSSAVTGSLVYRTEGRMLGRYADATDQWRLLTTTNLTSGNFLVLGHNTTSFPNSFTTLFIVDYAGKVTTGVWNGTKIAEAYGGTNQTTYTTGDLLYASGANTLAKLAIGSAGQVLGISSGVPAWVNNSQSFLSFGNATTTADTTTRYLDSWNSTAANGTVEIGIPCPVSGTVDKLYVWAQTGPVTQGQTITVRKNGSDQSLTCLLAAATQNAFDTTNSFTVAAGDVITCKCVGVAGITVGAIAIQATMRVRTT